MSELSTAAWLIEYVDLSKETDVVLSPLTDESFMDEVEEAESALAAMTVKRDHFRDLESTAIGMHNETLASLAVAETERDAAKAEAQALLPLLIRYRNETPLCHQPHMIAHEADAAIAAMKDGS